MPRFSAYDLEGSVDRIDYNERHVVYASKYNPEDATSGYLRHTDPGALAGSAEAHSAQQPSTRR